MVRYESLKLPKRSVVLVDGHGLMHRAFHGCPKLTASDGTPTGAVCGTLLRLMGVIEKCPRLIFCADVDRDTFRREIYPGYKANRQETDPDLVVQFSLIEEFCHYANIPFYKKKGYEADDLIGSLAVKAAKQGYFCLILSGDKDMFQLINNQVKSLYITNSDIQPIGKWDVVKEYGGLTPAHLVDLKGLQGDPADNIPGVKGVGPKTAIKLLTECDTLENVYKNIDTFKGKLKENLIIHREIAFLSRDLSRIKCDLDLDFRIKEASFGTTQVQSLLERLNINSLLQEYAA